MTCDGYDPDSIDALDYGENWTEFVIPTSAEQCDIYEPFERLLRDEYAEARRDNLRHQEVRNISTAARARLPRAKQQLKFNRARRGWR